MFEREQLLDEFDVIFRQRSQAAEQLRRVLAQMGNGEMRQQLEEIHSHASRHVELAERLLEIVG